MTINSLEIETRPEAEEPQPFSRQELRGMLRAPLRLIDLVLGERRRFAANVAQAHRLPSLLLVLAVAVVVCALPFGVVLVPTRFWRVAELLLGSLAICFPALHVFGRYVGGGLSLAQTLCISLVATATTSLFTLAFAPIVAFLRATMSSPHDIRWSDVAFLLLFGALVAGIGQLFRLLRGDPVLRARGRSLSFVLIPWLALYLFITVRLAGVLGLVS
jgi:hypothetical protein